MRLGSLKPLLSVPKKRNQQINVEPGREWYNTKQWKLLRLKIFLRDRYKCQWEGCGRLEWDTSKLVCHHRKAHKGNRELFWDENNLMTVCKTCHDGPISSIERIDPLKGTWY